MNHHASQTNQGFTLMEVLIALAVIAIAFTALLKASSQTIAITQRMKEKSIRHWVAMQAVTAIQLGVLPAHPSTNVTEVTHMFNKSWYWRAELSSTPLKTLQKITITVSEKVSGPYGDALIAFRYFPES